jgi:hypothetical protein
MRLIVWILVSILLVPSIIGTCLWLLRFLVRPCLTEDAVSIKCLGITVRRISFTDIADAKVVAFMEFLPFSKGFQWKYVSAERWGGLCKHAVVLEKRGNPDSFIILSPDNPGEFASRVLAGRPPGQ